MSNIGWLKIHRTIRECWMWSIREPFDKRSAWMDMVMEAFFSDSKVTFRGSKIYVKRGQFPTSVRSLSERWMWSVAKVNRYIDKLKSEQMINTERINNGTLITIVNYEIYQCDKNSIDTLSGTLCETEAEHLSEHERYIDRYGSETEAEHNIKNNKNIKNEKNNYTVSKDTVRQTEAVRRVVDEWNTLEKCGIASVQRLKSGSNRYAMLVARIKEYGLDSVLKAIDNIRHSKFLQGKSDSKRCWVITFDWFVRPNCFPKVLEGQYNDDDVSGSSQQSITDKQLEALAEKQKVDMQGEMLSDEEINRLCEEEGW